MSNEIPEIQPLQFEQDDVGKLSRSVNMFRGDVNFSKNLVQLPGKPGDATLAIGIGLQYCSNVHQDVTRWNLDAPTSVVGLGWSIARDQIVASSTGALTAAATQYTYLSAGISNALIPDPTPWLRVQLDQAAVSSLQPGTVSSQVIAEFAAQGVALGSSATVSAAGGGEWLIQDPEFERVFLVKPTDSGGDVFDGGERFQLQNYEFWQIAYYPDYEKWEITTESGEVRIFGGGVSTTSEGFKQSTGNSVEWGVKWGGTSGNWSGPSPRTDAIAGQTQFAKAWNLAARRDRWGDQVTYAYNEFPRDANGLLGRNVEQQVGTGGLPYTKAVYPTTITDLYGRTVTFTYGDKSFTSTVQEYLDPHKVLTPASAPETPPSNLGEPNAYQDEYETLYLQSISVASPTGELLYAIDFSYLPPQVVSTTPTELQVTAAKRYLSGISERNAYGERLPGFSYDYYLDAADGPNVGALKSITYPQGSVATWTYTNANLDICVRDQQVSPPAAVGTNATPYVWYGSDYTLSVWVSQDGSTVTLDVYTWVGRWQQWSATTPLYSSQSATVVANTIQTVTNQSCFAVAFATSDGNTQAFLFNRVSSQPDQWSAAPFAPTLTGENVALSAGDTFILATQVTEESGQTLYQLYRWTWSWQTGWSGLDTPVLSQSNPLFAASSGEYYLTASIGTTSTTIAINWIDGSGCWHSGGTSTFPWTTAWNEGQTISWSLGPSFVAISVAEGPTTTTYGVQLVRWDQNYQFVDAEYFTGFQSEAWDRAQGVPWPPPPTVVDNQFVGVRQNLFRFDGASWQSQSFPPSTLTYGWLAFAYGDDVAVQVVNDDSDAITSLLAYDPNGSGFANAPLPITTPLPSSGSVNTQGYPSASGGDFLVARNAVYYRGFATDWQDAVQTPVFELTPTQSLAENVSSQSIINQAPAFLAYLVTDDAEPANNAVQTLVLGNGGVLSPLPDPLDSTSYFTTLGAPNTNPAGQLPSGGATLVTYPASAPNFSQAPWFTLYRYAGQAMSGPIEHFPVQALSFSDGFGSTYQVAYEFDAASAACDPTGMVVKYYRSATYDGTANPLTSAYGRTVYSYYNGTAPGTGYSMLDGLLQQQARFAGSALFSTQYSTNLGLSTSDPNGQAIPVPTELASAFQTAGISLSDQATLQCLQIDGVYLYWQVTDPTSGATYNVDYTGDPTDPNGVRVFDGSVVQSMTTEWTVFTARNLSPTTPDANPAPLHGGYARPASTVQRKDTVPLTTTLSYLPDGFQAPFSGMPVTRSWSLYNGAGALEVHNEVRTYGYEVYGALLQLNLLTPVAELRKTVSVGTSTVTTSSVATTWRGWTQAGGAQLTLPGEYQQWRWIGDPSGQDVGDFPFDGEPDTSLWRLVSTANLRNDAGLVIDSTDATGLRHGTLYDTANQVELALVTNASFAAGQAAYCGFEAYEDLSAWTLGGGAKWNDADAHTGVTSLELPGAGATASRQALTPDPSQTQFFSAWYKTPSGFTGGVSGWTITVSANGTVVGQPVVVPFDDTGGTWTYVSTPIDLPSLVGASASDVTVTIVAANAASQPVLIDDVTLVPLVGIFTARAYDPVFRLPIDRLDQTGKTWRTIRDTFMNEIGGSDPVGVPVSLQLTYFSLAGNPSGFSASDPNASIALKAFSNGTYQTFRDGQGWQSAWTASDPGAFVATNGVLQHSSTTSGATLTAASPVGDSFALFVELVPLGDPPLALSDSFAIGIGSGATFTWSPNSGQWSLLLNGSTVAPLAQVGGPPRSCLLVQLGGSLLFYADGQLLFSQAATVSGAPTISSGANALGLTNLTLLIAPAMKVQFSDATGAARQAQVLTAEDYLVNETIRDGRGKPIVHTKPAPGNFGTGATLPVLTYRPGFVDVSAFLANLDASGTMTGDVNDWYNGVNDTDDGGYPYTRSRLEPSQLARPLELGFPGVAQAIVDAGTTSPASRATVQFAYRANQADELPYGLKLPEGQYQVNQLISQTKTVSATVHDACQNIVARYTPLTTSAYLNTTVPTYANGTTSTAVVLPNSYALEEPTQVTTDETNALGQLTGESSPDGQSTRLLYDAGGRVRFAQDAQAAAQGIVTYFTWDVLGRRRSRGTFTFDWTASSQPTLQQYAEQATWPEGQTEVTYQVLCSWSYDGDGSDSNAIGSLASRTSVSGSGSTAVQTTESFTWNATGTLATRSVTISQGTTSLGSYSLGYTYDAQRRLVGIDYPEADATGVSQVRYVYDGRDRVLAITDGNGVPFVQYTYNPAGRPIAQKLGASSIPGSFGYDSPGRLTSLDVSSGAASFSLSLTYQTDGTLATHADATTGTGVNDQASVTYTYDELQRLLSATDAEGKRSLAVTYTTASQATDQNGNVQTLSIAGAQAATVSYNAGTNQLSKISPSAGTPVTYQYLPNGLLESRNGAGATPSLSLSYLPGTALPATITNQDTDQSIQLAYDGNGHRVFKQLGGGAAELYVNGGGAGPLVSIDSSGTATAWIYGPTGLVGMARGGERYAIVVDYLRSPRVVLDENGELVASYAYNAFGQIVSASEPSPGFLPFLFGGRQLDRETGLCYFQARLYDPAIGRFLAPDPRGQYASPYLYAGNLPTMLIDPSGEMSALGEAGLDLGLLILFAVATAATAGAAATLVPAAVAAGGIVSGALVGAGIGAVGGAISAGAWQGLKYGLTTPPGSWSWESFGTALGIGAAAGAVGGLFEGGIGGLLTPAAEAAEDPLVDTTTPELTSPSTGGPSDDIADASSPGPSEDVTSESEQAQAQRSAGSQPERSPAPRAPQAKAEESWSKVKATAPRRIGVGVISKAVGGAAQGVVQQALTNVVDHRPWSQGVLRSSLVSAAFGVASGAAGGAFGAANDAYQLSSSIFTAVSSDTVGYATIGAGLGLMGTSVVFGGLVVWTSNLRPYGSN